MKLVEPKHPALHTKANINPFETDIDWAHREQEMFQLMRDKIGIGLASPQLGYSYNMFVMTHSSKGDIGVYNPQILASSDETVVMEEGCLSLPEQYADVERPKEIMLEYMDENEKIIKKQIDGYEARILQHEIDHLSGKLFVDYLSSLKRNVLIKKVKKLQHLKK